MRSKFEVNIKKNNKGLKYESIKVDYIVPESKHKYTPDFVLKTKSGGVIIVEAKGLLTRENRAKHLLIKEQHPELDIRFLFQRAKNLITKGSKTTYSMWAEKNGFKWAEGVIIPQEWYNE